MSRVFSVAFHFCAAFACCVGCASSSSAELSVTNVGRCGQNSVVARERFEADVVNAQPKPDYVLIYIGMNDVINDHFFTPLDQYIENVRWMVEQSRNAGVTPILCTIHHIVEEKVFKVHTPDKFAPETPNSKMDRYNTALKKLAEELKVPVADFFAVTEKTPPSEFLSDDGVHLSPSGNKLLAKTFFDVIAPNLRGDEKIVCVGDSLTFGYQNAGAGTADGDTYPAMLKQMPLP